MIFKKTVVASTISLLMAGNAMAANTYFDARNDAMGGVGVASSLNNSALLANPALIAKSEKLSLTLPSVGLQLSDKSRLIDDSGNIQSKLKAYQESDQTRDARARAGELKSLMEAVKDTGVNLSGGLSASAIIPTETNKFGLFVKAHADATVHNVIAEKDLQRLDEIKKGVIPVIDFEKNMQSEVRGLAAWTIDYGVSIARSFEIAGKTLHVGISPKMQGIKTYHYADGINKYEGQNVRNSQYQSQHTRFNVDLGLASELSEQLTVGLVGKNLLSNKLETEAVSGESFTYQVSPVVTVGTAYHWDRLTAAADIDLTTVKAFSNQKGSQYAGIGVEWEACSWAKLRAGYRIDMKKSKPNMATVGLGFHPGERFKLDVAAMAGAKKSLGAVLQLSMVI